jgi:hypothetical protein
MHNNTTKFIQSFISNLPILRFNLDHYSSKLFTGIHKGRKYLISWIIRSQSRLYLWPTFSRWSFYLSDWPSISGVVSCIISYIYILRHMYIHTLLWNHTIFPSAFPIGSIKSSLDSWVLFDSIAWKRCGSSVDYFVSFTRYMIHGGVHTLFPVLLNDGSIQSHLLSKILHLLTYLLQIHLVIYLIHLSCKNSLCPVKFLRFYCYRR